MSDLLNSASLVMIPSGYKEDVVYSQIPTDGSGDLSFTRASNGTRVNSSGLVEVCPWNLADDSNGFGGLSAITKTTGQVSPIDSTSGNLLTATGSGEHYSGTASLTVVVGNSYTYSVYGKFVQGINLALRTVFANGNEDISTIWNLSTGALLQNATAHTNPTITAVGNGYYRCSITYTPTSVPAFPLLFRLQMAVGTNLSFTASSGDGFLAYGAQINNGALAPYFPTNDRLNVPRLTYQNGGGGCPSLLLEKQSTNEFVRSEQFDNASWIKGANLSVTANSIVSPDGTQNADTVTNSGANSVYIYQLSQAQGTTWTTSLYAKKGTNKYLGIAITAYSYVNERYQPVFNLDDGTIQAQNTSGTNVSNTSCSITPVGNGWYRITATGTFVAGADYCYAVIQSSNNTNYQPDTATGSLDWTNATNGNAYLWGAQIEASSYPTSYIPTTSSSATRVADVCSKTGISSLIGQTEGVLFADVNVNITGTAANFAGIAINDGTSSNVIGFGYYQDGRIQAVSFVSGSLVVNINLPSFGLTSGSHKFALAYKLNDYVLYVDGVQVGSDTSASVPATSVFLLSDLVGADISYNQAILFKTRLTNAELASLTTI
jgi:hypothetical protein